MLDCSPKNLLNEIDDARQLVNRHIERAKDLISSMVGANFEGGQVKGRPSPDNYVFEYMSLMMGRVLADNPAVSITSPFQQYEFITDALQDCLDQWTKRADLRGSQLKQILSGLVTEQLVLFGAALVTFVEDPYSPVTKSGTRRMRPVVSHIPYWRYFKDKRTCNGVPSRFKGHLWVKDREDLLNDPTYNRQMVEKLAKDAGLDEIREDNQNGPSRDEIVGYEVWVPDAPVESDDPAMRGCLHGKIYTLGVVYGDAMPEKDERGMLNERKVNATGYLRDPVPFYGTAAGPYVEFGGFPVPGSPYTVSALLATKEQGEETNAHYMAIQETALQRKDIILTSSTHTGLKNTLKNAIHGHVYGVKGFQPGLYEQVSIGGPSKEMIDYALMASERRDRVLGMSEAMRGEPQTGNTATADNIAAQSNNVRIEVMAGFVKDATAALYRQVAFYMFSSEFFVSRLSSEYAQKYGLKTPYLYSGGDHEQSDGLLFEDLSFDIQPYSMERVDPLLMQGRMQQVVGLQLQLAPARVQFPFINWKMLDQQLARAHNFRWMGTLVNEEQLQQAMQSMAQTAQAAAALEQQKSLPAIPYAQAPADVKAQIEAKWGITPSTVWSLQPLLDPSQPSQSKNPMFLPPGAQAMAGGEEQPGKLATHMMGKAGAPGARNAPRNASSSSGMGASALQGRDAA